MGSKSQVVRPDFEVSICGNGGEQVLVVGIFIEEDGKVDFGVGWDAQTELSGIRALLDATSLALQNIGNWRDVSDLATYNERKQMEGDELPF